MSAMFPPPKNGSVEAGAQVDGGRPAGIACETLVGPEPPWMLRGGTEIESGARRNHVPNRLGDLAHGARGARGENVLSATAVGRRSGTQRSGDVGAVQSVAVLVPGGEVRDPTGEKLADDIGDQVAGLVARSVG